MRNRISVALSNTYQSCAKIWRKTCYQHRRLGQARQRRMCNRNVNCPCMRYLRSKNSFFTGVPFLILGRKVFNCQHGIDRTAGEKRKRKDAEEVLYIIISFYPQPLCFCQLWLANLKGQIHEWVI